RTVDFRTVPGRGLSAGDPAVRQLRAAAGLVCRSARRYLRPRLAGLSAARRQASVRSALVAGGARSADAAAAASRTARRQLARITTRTFLESRAAQHDDGKVAAAAPG